MTIIASANTKGHYKALAVVLRIVPVSNVYLHN